MVRAYEGERAWRNLSGKRRSWWVGWVMSARTNAHTLGLGRAARLRTSRHADHEILKNCKAVCLSSYSYRWLSGKMQVISSVDVGES
jgi:hypothetical protein